MLLCFLCSSPAWYLSARDSLIPQTQSLRLFYALITMWSPAVAAFLTRLWYQRNLRGFGLRLGKARYLFLGMLLPILAGLVMFGSAWIFGVAPLDTDGLSKIFSPRFMGPSVMSLVIGCFFALGEELGWRGFLVPELSRFMNFTRTALVSSAIWTVWHFPLIAFSSYHGSGPLWCSLATFVLLVMALGPVQAWLRLASGSVWPAVLLHGFWNYFIQGFYPTLTQKTSAGEMMLGEFGWCGAVMSGIVLLAFWRWRNHLSEVVA